MMYSITINQSFNGLKSMDCNPHNIFQPFPPPFGVTERLEGTGVSNCTSSIYLFIYSALVKLCSLENRHLLWRMLMVYF